MLADQLKRGLGVRARVVHADQPEAARDEDLQVFEDLFAGRVHGDQVQFRARAVPFGVLAFPIPGVRDGHHLPLEQGLRCLHRRSRTLRCRVTTITRTTGGRDQG